MKVNMSDTSLRCYLEQVIVLSTVERERELAEIALWLLDRLEHHDEILPSWPDPDLIGYGPGGLAKNP